MKFKLIILLAACMLAATSAGAQHSNLVVFTQSGQSFTVILNGIQQSPDPVTNLKITGLNATSYKVKATFSNKAIPDIDKTAYLQAESEVTYEILKNSKGIWVMRLLNTVPLDEVMETGAGQVVFVYSETPRISTTTVSQTTTITAGTMTGTSLMTGASVTTTTTETVSGGTHEPDHHDYTIDYPEYQGPKGCPRPMDPHSFDQALESISSKTFEDSKLTIAKQIAGSNCLRSKQVKDIMKLFTYESSRLEFAKYAYKYTWDINNYFLLNDAFEYESSIDDLNRYINSRR
jgi:hypothetical protein